MNTELKCQGCGQPAAEKKDKRGAPRIPRGWHRTADACLCPECWNKLYVRRALVIPIAAPVGLSWEDFRKLLNAAWAQSTALANWTVTELSKRDIVRVPSIERLPPPPSPYLYPLARASFPELTPSAVVATLNTVARNYNKRRPQTIWRSEASVQRYRYPYPYLVPGQAWTLRHLSDTQKVPLLSFPLGGQRVTARLQGGKGWRRQAAMLAQIIGGSALGGELSIDRQRDNANDNRNGQVERVNGGGAAVHFRIRARIAGWFPRPVTAKAPDTMRLSAGKDYFLEARIAGRDPWTLHCQQLEQWNALYYPFLHRMADDLKYEKRWPHRTKQHMLDELTRRRVKHDNRLRAFTHMTAAMVVAFAKRNGIGRIEYDGRVKKFPNFHWYNLERLLKEKAELNGIDFASAEVMPENADALADT